MSYSHQKLTKRMKMLESSRNLLFSTEFETTFVDILTNESVTRILASDVYEKYLKGRHHLYNVTKWKNLT